MLLHVSVLYLLLPVVSGVPAVTAPLADGSSTVNVPEDTGTGNVIYNVLPTDPTWTYSITAPAGAPFNVNAGGAVEVSGALDFETTTSYSLTIQITDADPSSVDRILIVQITNVFEQPPVFSGTYTISIDEGDCCTVVPTGYTVTDPETGDGDTLTYALSGPGAAYFRIDPTTGVVTIRSLIDYDAGVTSLVFTVDVTDSVGLAASQAITVTINDINDNSPICSPAADYATVPENSPAATVVGTITCTDHDSPPNSDLTYSIASGDDATAKFQLTTTTISTTATALDYETKQVYNLIIHAVDTPATGTPKTGVLTFQVQVGPVNEDSPAWAAFATTHSVSEVATVPTDIVTVSATDADSGADGIVTYQLVSIAPNNPAGAFTLDATSGLLRTAATLDREAVASYAVTVRANDGGTTSNSSPDSVLTINIADVNDNAPTLLPVSGTVTEDSPVGTSILTVAATDADATATFTYSVIGGDPNSKFTFNAVTPGQLDIADVIDLDVPFNDPIYSLTVHVSDGGTPVLTATTIVTVTVTSTNDHTPVIPALAPVSVPESDLIGTFTVATVTGTDGDYGTFGDLTYTITGGNTNTDFVIDTNTGKIITQNALDYDAGTRNYALEVTATDGGGLTESTIVTISVTNVNDNTPSCPTSPVIISIPETGTVPTPVTTLACTDADTVDTLTYSITLGNTPVFFSINPTTGAIETAQALDYEGTNTFSLTVNVADDGTPPQDVDIIVTVQVTPVNEAAPVFAPATYTTSTAEDTVPPVSIVQVTATDTDTGSLDGTIRFSITAGDANGRFSIDQTTGQISLTNPLDRESVDTYTLTISAADDVPGAATQNVVTTTVTVTVDDFNDNAPVFNPQMYTASPLETSVPLSVLLTVTATDDDLPADPNSNIDYTIDPATDPTGVFEFNGADLRIAAGMSLVGTTSFDLTIIATDQGAIPLSCVNNGRVLITVQQANLNAPIFTNPDSTATIPESTPIGTVVITSTATDADTGIVGTVTYAITGGNVPADSFVIGSTSGDVLVWSTLDFDIPPNSWTLTLQATDGGGTTTDTSLQIDLTDVNDNFPQFASNIFNLAIDENLAAATSVAQYIATDADSGVNGVVEYSFTSGNGIGSFAVDLTSGDITTTAVLDFETQSVYNLVLQARDTGTPSNSATALIVVSLNDLNDNTPIFTPVDQITSLDENVAIGTVVTTVAANDADSTANSNGLFTFALTSTEFAIDANTGEITTIANIDRETAASYVLTITATDQLGLGPNIGTGTVTVNINDLNDNNPVITGTYTKTLSETTPVNEIIFTIAATDADDGVNAQLSYAITAGNTNTDFKIEPSSGILQLANPLDRETTASYTLTVSVTDGGTPSRNTDVIVTLTVIDTNDNDPVFQGLPYTFNIAENVPAGSAVATVLATDADTGVNGAIGYTFPIFWQGNQTHFSIGGASGAIITNGGLDRETQDTYIIWLHATDNGIPIRSATVNVTITITDLNDNDPVFDAASYSGAVSEGDTVGTSILTIGVTDADIGANAAVTLSIDTTSAAGTRANTFLSIDSATGILSLLTTVDRETDASFIFNILAVDGGATPRTSTTTVTVTVTDVNDNTPVISPQFYNTEVAYNGACTSIITTVTATDADSGVNGLIVYSLVASTYTFLFNVDSTSGEFSLLSTATSGFKYQIQVSATDAGTPALTSATPATLRIDSFDPNSIVVTFKLSVDLATFTANQATFQSSVETILRATYPTALFRVWCVEVQSIPSLGRRRLLQTTSNVEVHGYTITDSSTETAANIGLTKNFLSASQSQALLAVNPQGTPSFAVTTGNLTSFGVTSVTTYYESVTPWHQTDEGIAVLTIVSLIILALIITAVVVTIVACRKHKRKPKPVTPLRKGRRARRASIETIEDKHAIGRYRELDAPPAYSEKPLPMKPGEDGVASLTYSGNKVNPVGPGVREFSGRAVDAETGKVYAYNTKTNVREWVTTPEGRSVKVTHH